MLAGLSWSLLDLGKFSLQQQAQENPIWEEILLEAMLPGYIAHDTILHREKLWLFPPPWQE